MNAIQRLIESAKAVVDEYTYTPSDEACYLSTMQDLKAAIEAAEAEARKVQRLIDDCANGYGTSSEVFAMVRELKGGTDAS